MEGIQAKEKMGNFSGEWSVVQKTLFDKCCEDLELNRDT